MYVKKVHVCKSIESNPPIGASCPVETMSKVLFLLRITHKSIDCFEGFFIIVNIFVLFQIKVAMDTQRNFESLIDEITADIDKTKRETSSQVVRFLYIALF